MPKSNGDEDHIIEEKKVECINIAHQENQSSQVSTKGCDELENAKAEMGEVRQENQRLKMVLQHISKDYQSLQLRFFELVKQEDSKKLATDHNSVPIKDVHDHQTEEKEADLVSLTLGRSPRSSEANENIIIIHDHDHDQDHHDDLKANLTLGLGSEMQLSSEVATVPSPESSTSEELKEKSPKTLLRNGDDDVSHEQPPAKRARVSVGVRCDTPTMNDGCQWRKYGQKIVKGNPYPRAYYRCTVAPSCPVRKQVQRCANEMSILITTYEGTHNHPLPVTATAMASTTSAAASMLSSSSSTSSDHPTTDTASTKNAPTMLNGLNFGHFDTLRAKPFYLPNSASSSSPLFPTISLDLTSSPISSSSSSPPYIFNRSSLPSSLARIPSSSISFGNSSSEPNILPTLAGNGSYLGYGNTTLIPYDKSLVGSLYFAKQANPVHESLTETLTKAITFDPGAFKSVIAATISFMVGGRESTLHGKQDGAERLGQGFNLGEQNGKGLAYSHFNRLSSSNF